MTRISDPYEALASLFLTEPEDAESGPDAQPSLDASQLAEGEPARVRGPLEVALVGHLPVMGGLWLTQYADQVARLAGPTALVRLERGQATVELLRAPGQRCGLDATESLGEALHLLAERAVHWIVCPAGESAIDGPLPGDALTLLTGSDDAATVAAYRIVKSLAERWHAAHWPMPPIGLVVLGAPPERVDEVADKLDRTTKAFLDVDLSVVAHHQRMDAIESAGRRTFTGAEPPLAEVCRQIETLIRRPRKPVFGSRTPVGPSLTQPAVPTASTATRPFPSIPVGPRAVAPPPVALPAGQASGRPSSIDRPPSGWPVAKLSPKGVIRREQMPAQESALSQRADALRDAGADPAPLPFTQPVEAATPAELPVQKAGAPVQKGGAREAAAREIEAKSEAPAAPRPPAAEGMATMLPGLETLPPRCPAFPAVELAVDAHGTLHLVAELNHAADLVPVQAWAKAHRGLLRMACPRLASAPGEHIELHVVTCDAPSVALLHGAGWRLHAVVTAASGERIAVALNR